jgi:hypothetical protein
MTLAEERKAFETQLSDLLAAHRNQYVLFKDGKPVAFFADNATAYDEALKRFGVDATFLIAQVVEQDPQPVSLALDAGVMFV